MTSVQLYASSSADVGDGSGGSVDAVVVDGGAVVGAVVDAGSGASVASVESAVVSGGEAVSVVVGAGAGLVVAGVAAVSSEPLQPARNMAARPITKGTRIFTWPTVPPGPDLGGVAIAARRGRR